MTTKNDVSHEEELMVLDTAKRFTEQYLTPNAAHWDEECVFPVDVIKKAGEQGFCGLYADESIGGLSFSRRTSSLVFEILSAGCTSTTAYLTIHNMVSWMVGKFASQAIKESYGEKLTSGEYLGSYCLTEANAGSDAASLKTNAVKNGSDYILNGEKIFISGAGATDVLIVMARTGEKGSKGISAFVVPANSQGISYGKKERKMGWNSQPTRAVHFDQVTIPADNILGDIGEGFSIAMQGLNGGRINIASCSLGTAAAAIRLAHEYSQTRKQFDKAIGSFQGIQFKLSDMMTQLTASQQLTRYAASCLDNGDKNAPMYCAMAKQFTTDSCFDICNEALQIFGGNGYMKDYPLERFVRDTRVHKILEGTNEIMRVIIAKQLMSEETLDNYL